MNTDFTKVNNLEKKKVSTIYLSYDDFINKEKLIHKIRSVCTEEKRYSILFRVCYNLSETYTDDLFVPEQNEGGEWKALGEQEYLCYKDNTNFLIDVNNMFDTIVSRLNYSLELYNKSVGEINCFQILVYNIDYTEKAVKKPNLNIKSLGDKKDLINVSKTKKAYNIIPFTTDITKFGIKLKTLVEDNKVYVLLSVDNKLDIDVLNRKLPEKERVDDNTLFYLNNSNLITVISNKTNNIIKVYTLEGNKICAMVDEKQSESNMIIRKIGNISLYINNNEVYNKEIDLDLNPIKPKKLTGMQARMIHPDWRFGTMDIETFRDIDNLSKPYAAGFYTDKGLRIFYVNEDLNFNNVLVRCIDSMLVEKFNKFKFFVHNLGKYDIVFILKVLIDVNENYPDTYKYDLIFKDDTILAINISKRVNNKVYSIKLVDSYNILNSSLIKLCKSFETNVYKTLFPYDFISRNTLFYKGNKPDISYYNINTNIDPNYRYKTESYTKKDYDEIKTEWSTKEDTEKYLENDLISLYQVLDKFKKQIYIDYKTHITNNLTISGLALDIYLKSFYNYSIPLINKRSLYNDLKSSYFGGITEVYKPYGKNLYYYDVNSLYPFSALNPMPGLKCKYIESINKYMEDYIKYDKFFGFYYCEIETNEDYIGLLPVRTDTGLVMPIGVIKGWYFSEELKFAYENGYKIKVIKGYQFSKSINVFDNYIKEFYRIKSTTKDSTMKAISKSLLNNLLGRFGLKLEKYVTRLVNLDEYNELLQTRKIKNVKFIGDKLLVTHTKDISKDICDKYDIDYNKAFIDNLTSNKKLIEKDTYPDVSIAISSAVTSYSRIFMNKIKLDILKKGGEIYYTDTDSIVTNIKLDDKLVGKDLGLFKLEYDIKEAYFISTKTYCLKTKQNDIIIKAKGANTDLLKFEDFVNLYKGKNLDTFRSETVRNYSLGSVTINNKTPICLSPYSYTKRIKVYSDNLWVDTKPIQNKNRNYHASYFKKYNNFFTLVYNVLWYIFVAIMFFVFLTFYFVYTYDYNIELEHNIFVSVDESKQNIESNNLHNLYSVSNNYNYNLKEYKYNFENKFIEKNTHINTSEKTIDYYMDESKIMRRVIKNHLQDTVIENIQKQRIIDKLNSSVEEIIKFIDTNDKR